MNKTIAYPLSMYNVEVISFVSMLKDISIEGVVSTELRPQEVYSITSLEMFTDFQSALPTMGTLVLLPLPREANLDTIIANVKMALEAHVQVKSLHCFSDSDYTKIVTNCDSTLFTMLYEKQAFPDIKQSYSRLIHKLNTPLVVITELSVDCELPTIELAIRERLLKNGYKVSQIGSTQHCGVFGLHPFPQFMYSTDVTESEKVYQFNFFVKEIEVSEQPDIFLLSVPAPLCPYDNKFTLDFGILPFLVSQAIVSDYSIVSLNYGEYNKEFIDNFNLVMEHRFNFLPDSFLMSCILMDYSDVDSSGNVRQYSFNSQKVDDAIKNSYGSIANIHSSVDMDNVVSKMIDVLAENCV